MEIQLLNDKSQVKKKKMTDRIVRHLIKKCNDNEFNNLRFTIVDCLNNVNGLTEWDTKSSQNIYCKREYIW